MAQALPGGVPQSVQPGRVLQPPLSTTPPSTTGGAIELPAPTRAAPSDADQLRFQLTDVSISGATVFDAAALRTIYQADIGRTVSLADVYGWADQITQKYRRAGYVLSQVIVPQQRIEGGAVRLTVVEGFIDQVKVQGASSARLQAEGRKLSAQRPLTAAALERYLLLANDLPGLSVQAVLSPSPTVAGAADLTLTARQKRVDASVEADNFGTAYQGPWLGTANVGFNDVLGHNERLALHYTTSSTPSELSLYGADLIVPLDYEGTQLDVGASRTQGRPGYSLAPFDVHTSGNAVSILLSHPLIRSRAQTLTLAADLSYLDAVTTLNLPGSSNDKVRALRLSAAYSLIDAYGGRNALTAEISEGLPILDATRRGDPLASRLGASNTFTKLDVVGSRLQPLGHGFALLGAFSAQTGFGGRLLSPEQFSLGGPLFGRGYDPAEITGDSGVAGKLELQKTLSLPASAGGRLAQLFGFYDAGEVFSQVSTDGVPAGQSLASAGGGVRFDLGHGLASTIEMAKPLTRVVAAEVGHSGDPKGVRAYFMLSASF